MSKSKQNQVCSGMADDPDMLVVLTTARTEFEAQTLAEALRARGIRAEVFATAASSLQWEAGFTDPIKVMVRRADVGEAEKVRAALKMDSVDIDWDEVETGADTSLTLNAESTCRRSSMLGTVSRIGWTMLAVVLALTVFGIAAQATHMVIAIVVDVDYRSPLPFFVGIAASVATLVVLWRLTRKK